jgi:hypothetical protein
MDKRGMSAHRPPLMIPADQENLRSDVRRVSTSLRRLREKDLLNSGDLRCPLFRDCAERHGVLRESGEVQWFVSCGERSAKRYKHSIEEP